MLKEKIQSVQYVQKDEIICKKEQMKCNNIIKQYKSD